MFSFLLLLPRAVLSEPGGADCAHYVHDAQRHYQLWLDITSSYSWRVGSNGGDTVPDNTASSTHSYDSRPEADMHLHARLDPDHGDADRLVEQPLDGRNEPDTSNIITQQPFINKSINHTYTPNNTRRQSLDERHDNHYLRATNRRVSHVDRRDYQCGSPAPTRTTDDDTSDSPRAEFRKSGNCPFTQKLVIHSRDDPASFQEEFDEGPFLRMLFKLLSTMPDQPYQVNLHLTSIISKLALIPHPNLHEYLLEPCLPTAAATRTLFKTLRAVAGRLSADIPRIKNFHAVIESTRLQLMSEDPAYDEIGEHNQLVESLIVLEEFCKELAAIAFVKHQHQYLAAQR